MPSIALGKKLIVGTLISMVTAIVVIVFALSLRSRSTFSSSSSSSSLSSFLNPQQLQSPSTSDECDNLIHRIRSTDRKLAFTLDTFPVDLTHAVCPDLVGISSSVAPNSTACEEICDFDPGCDLWQWCPYSVQSCLLHDRVSWTPGNWSRCYISRATTSRNLCEPDSNFKWIGAARGSSRHRVPTRSAPVTTKRGFSGFLYAAGGVPACADAQALGKQNSWYYNWVSLWFSFRPDTS